MTTATAAPGNLPTMMSGLTLQSNFSSQSFQNIDSAELESVGYRSSQFTGRDQQFNEVMDALDQSGLIPESLIESETLWFYNSLGIENTYFMSESVANIVSNIIALYSAKLDAYARGVTDKPFIHHSRQAEDHAVYFEASSNDFEVEIDDKFLDSTTETYRMESFNTLSNDVTVKCHFIYKCQFNENAPTVLDNKTSKVDIDQISDKSFINIATDHTKRLYTEVIEDVLKTEGPVIKYFTVPKTGEQRVIIGYHNNTSPRYNSSLTNLFNYYGLDVNRKYVEQFSNGITILSSYISYSESNNNLDLITNQIMKEASLLYTIPNNLFIDKFSSGELSIQECIYAHCGVIFTTHFLNRLGPEFNALREILAPSKSLQNVELINKIKKRLTSETYTQSYIEEVFRSQPELIKVLYRNFVDDHYFSSSIEKTLSYQRVSKIKPIKNEAEFNQILNRLCSQNEHHVLVFKALFSFNRSILKTNFFITSKIAISFRLDAKFLPESEYPNKPFGLFFVVGSDFRGFHIRFRDIARGGIRIVKSKSLDAYSNNMRNLFDENYNLASTQQRKNKDIPEGGSKGVILLNPGTAQDRPKECFTKYIDSLLDLLLSDENSDEKIVDLYKKPEILFMGPDENTAGYVDWATLHARKRNAPWWKSFFTGKSPTLGGIPHDEYGMTTLSVRSYVEKVYEKLGITDLSKVYKVQTGGPDGDLGSNEILLSREESYVALVDGSGVIVDEEGIDKQELIRLAKERKMIDHFDKSKLSSKGYIILVDDVDFKLPNGDIIASGLTFRNLFHLKIKDVFGNNKVQLFVPCGGRPAAIDADNVHQLIDESTGKSIVPIYVEGANLFITQPAKLILENAGAIVFKDASTNKGGVTSSSLEVLASLSFDDESFLKNMCVDAKTGLVPQFYRNYVKQVQSIIVRNAENEFESLWKLKQETNKSFSELSDELSVAINKLGDELANSKELWEDDPEFRNSVLIDALPVLLLQEVGIANILTRVPIAYLRAIFATRLASEFVYTKGIDANPAKFLEFISSLKRRINNKVME